MYLARMRTGRVIHDMVFVIFTRLCGHGRDGLRGLLPVGGKISLTAPRRVKTLNSLLVDQLPSLQMDLA
jgi:hypothetical protein